MNSKIASMLQLLQSNKGSVVLKCLTDLYKLSSISARELKESGIYNLVRKILDRNKGNLSIRQAAQKLCRRWHTLLAAYEQSEMANNLPDAMKPGCSRNFRSSSERVRHSSLYSNHHASPKLPATPDDALKDCSGESARSDESTFHHGLEPESKDKSSGQGGSRLHDPLHLESAENQDSMEGFLLRPDSGGSSGNSHQSNGVNPSDHMWHDIRSNLNRKFGNGSLNQRDDRDPARVNGTHNLRENFNYATDYSQRVDDRQVASINRVDASDTSPEDANLSIESSSEPTPSVSRDVQTEADRIRSIELNLYEHRFRSIKRNDAPIALHSLHRYLHSRQGYFIFKQEFEKSCAEHCKSKMPPDYTRRAFDFYNKSVILRDHDCMPPLPAPDHIYDFDRDFRRNVPTLGGSEGRYSRSEAPHKRTSEQHHAVNSSAHSAQVPTASKTTFDGLKHASNAFPASNYEEQLQLDLQKRDHLKRKSDKAFPMQQPERNSLEPYRKIPKTSSSRPSLPAEPPASSSESHRKVPPSSLSAFQGSQTDSSCEPSRKPPQVPSWCPGSSHQADVEGSASCMAKILQSVDDSRVLGCHSSKTKPITMLDVVMNPNIELVSPIMSPERVTPAPVAKTKEKSKHRAKHGESPTLEQSRSNISRLSPNVELNRPSTSKDSSCGETHRLSSTVSSPSLELPRPVSSKGSPNMDIKVPNPNGNQGSSTSKGASKETSKEKKPRQSKKKPEKGKLWARAKKDFDVLRKRN